MLYSLALLGVLLLSACSSDTIEEPIPDNIPDNIPDVEPSGDFEIRSAVSSGVLVEGDPNGLRIPISLDRANGHTRPVALELRGGSDEDIAFVNGSFSRLTLTPSDDDSEAILVLSISATPILPQQRQFVITASDGFDTDVMSVEVTVQPTSAPDVYLLAGQSNMVGFSGDGTRQAGPGGADEPNPRIKQLNASKNSSADVFVRPADFTSPSVNVVAPNIVTALDPLHTPQDVSNESGKSDEFIGLGLSFAKRALPDTSAEIILVPAAWSGTAFCTDDEGPTGNWMPVSSTNRDLGNTLLFDRAVVRANIALEQTGGVLRGILWHQGESDSNPRCAPVYAENLQLLVEEFRAQLDRVGNSSLRRVDSVIPFVAGTMSRGVDAREDLSVFSESKQMVDDAHRNFVNTVDAGGLSIHDDLIPTNGFPCGNTTCIHFGPGALREMGNRYYEAMLRAVGR